MLVGRKELALTEAIRRRKSRVDRRTGGDTDLARALGTRGLPARIELGAEEGRHRVH
jgi:hypothetical protein